MITAFALIFAVACVAFLAVVLCFAVVLEGEDAGEWQQMQLERASYEHRKAVALKIANGKSLR